MELSTYGVGTELSPQGWRDVIDHLLFEGLLVEDPNDGKPLLQLGDGAAIKAVYRGETTVKVRRAPERFDPSTRSGRPRQRTSGGAGRNAALETLDADFRARFEALRAWRKDRAAEQHVPPYVIFHDKTLVEIALREPGTLDALGAVAGVGQGKLDRYGKGVLEALATLA